MTSAHRASPDGVSLAKVALPTEHGGWSLTLEPAILGLIVAASLAGVALGGVALIGFLIRTPLKLSLGDRRRGRRLPRTVAADRIVVAEGIALLGLLAAAVSASAQPFWAPLLLAVPLFAIELWFDARSKGRHLLPELAGTIGIGAIATAIALAGGAPTAVAWGLWAVTAARALAAIPFVRLQLRRAKQQTHDVRSSDLAQAGAVVVVAVSAIAGAAPAVAVVAIAVLALVHVIQARRPPPVAPLLGAQQVVLGLAVVVVAGLGAAAP